ncbi:MAG: protease complex subunit PrcB family protein [Flavobacteriaceae bacterium]|nr:protease complex subunit PrcB family protein [Flavobacteriaceae bacterium]
MKLGLLLLTILIGCSSSKNVDTPAEKNNENTQLSFEVLVEDQIGGFVKEEIRIIKNRESLLEVYGYVNRIRKPGFSIPKVDFSKETIIAVFMGEKTTGGFSVTIENVKEENKKLIVKIKETKPGPKDMVTMAITQPFCFVKINNVGKEFVFEKL